MEEKKEALLNAVKTAAVQYGLEGMTTRNIAEIACISDAHLYRFFESKEELLLEAYKRNNEELIGSMIRCIDELEDIPLQFRSKVRFHFHKSWQMMLSDKERLAFCVYYFHSPSFSLAADFHKVQLDMLMQRLRHLFPDDDSCKRTLYTVMTMLYDSCKRVADGILEDTPETEEREYQAFYKLFTVFVKEEFLRTT